MVAVVAVVLIQALEVLEAQAVAVMVDVMDHP